MRRLIKLCLILLFTTALARAEEKANDDITAKTANGDEVILHSNGYWEFVDTKKAAEAKTKVEAFERSNGCPLGSRRSFLGIGRCISFDDPVLKRGSLSGKGK